MQFRLHGISANITTLIIIKHYLVTSNSVLTSGLGLRFPHYHRLTTGTEFKIGMDPLFINKKNQFSSVILLRETKYMITK